VTFEHIEVPDNFLGLEEALSTYETAQVVVLPIPYEATVSYGGGTAAGPAAIITASQQVELYDREYDEERVRRYGIHTLPALDLPADGAEATAHIAQVVETQTRAGKLVVGLGGEHTLSGGFGRGILDAVGEPVTVLQIDAHSDLRDEYEGTPYSHACVARRLLEDPRVEQLLQLGIRSVCEEEVQVARQHPDRVRVWYTEEVHESDWRSELQARTQGRNLYITIDVDGLDPAIIPATGTPEPDGLTWRQTLEILRIACEGGRVVGLDCVELAPVEGLHGADFAAAKLVYKAISYAMASRTRTWL
jgi:agmatinase